MTQPLSWIAIVRLGLVQTALGAIVVLTTSTINRVMVVELALPAMVPGALVALHYAVQMTRPRWGYGSDVGGRRTPWIIGGMAVLGLGGTLAAVATALTGESAGLGLALAVVAFTLVGGGVGAAGTSLLALLATRVGERRRAASAAIVWIMMIAGMAVTATIAGGLLDPFSSARLITVAAGVSMSAVVLATIAVIGIERSSPQPVLNLADSAEPKPPFRAVLKEVWAEPRARQFTIFVFVSMLAYSAQDLVLEPFAGHVFSMTPGETTALSGVHHGGVLVGMIVVAVIGSVLAGHALGSMRRWAIGGCVGSAIALAGLAMSGAYAPDWPLRLNIFALGFANGAFAVAAIGSMMGLASAGRSKREGVRMGLWGAAQAIAFGLGGFLGTVAIDVTRALFGTPETAYGLVFLAEAGLFLVSAYLAARLGLIGQTAGSVRESPVAETEPAPLAPISHGPIHQGAST